MNRRIVLACVTLLTACGTSGANSALTQPKIDSLPGGIIRVNNSGPTRWADTNGWKLVLENTFVPPENTPAQFNQPTAIVVDSHGRMFVLDRKPTMIKVYAADGTFTGGIGRDGSGPGEFRQWGMLTISRDTLFHHDPGQSRTQSFSADGAFLHAWTSLCCWQMSVAGDDSGRTTVPGEVHADSNNKNFMGGAGYIRYFADGRVSDTVIMPTRPAGKNWVVMEKGVPRMTMSVPLTAGLMGAFDRTGRYAWGMQDQYTIVISRHGRDTVRLFSSNAPKVPIPDSIRQERFDEIVKSNPDLKAIANFDDVPKNYSAWTTITSDGNGNFWVLRPGPHTDGDVWDVFTADGVLLGAVPAPFHNSYRSYWTRDRVYTLQEDEASGAQSIKVYRIDRGGVK